MFVPVVNKKNQPLMPTKIRRAKRWVASGKGTLFWKKGLLCVRLNVEPSDDKKQAIVVGIDPGSKREGYCVKSKAHTYFNFLSETPDWIKDALEVRRNMRRARRWRNCRRREARFDNRHSKKLPPSTKARWQMKPRVVNQIVKIIPITDIVIEDICAVTKSGKRKWNVSFSPIEVGKKWAYEELSKFGKFSTKQGHETKAMRDQFGLVKDKNKLSDTFYAHNVDSWVLANFVVGGHEKPDNEMMIKIVPLQFNRRRLHTLQPAKGGKRRIFGGTMSMGFKRGSLVKHKQYGTVYVGGTSKSRISVHNINTGKRIAQNVKPCECKFLTFGSFRNSSHP